MPNKVFLAALASLGCRSARTALNSGNAVFLVKPGPKDDLPEKIRAALEVHAGWPPGVAALRLSELGRAMEECRLAAPGSDASIWRGGICRAPRRWPGKIGGRPGCRLEA